MDTQIEYTDTQLFRQIAEGSEQAFREIFHRHNAKLASIIARFLKSEPEAEEVIQETFLRVWLKRSTLSEIENPGAWLYRIASNLALTKIRQQASTRLQLQSIHDNPDFDTASNENDQFEILHLKEVQQSIDEAVAQLPPSRREVFTLSRIEGLNRTEISIRMNISESTVKNQLGAALKFIQHHIRKSSGLELPAFLLMILLKK